MFKIFSTYICWINKKMQHMEVSGAVRPLKWSLGVKWLRWISCEIWSAHDGFGEISRVRCTVRMYSKNCFGKGRVSKYRFRMYQCRRIDFVLKQHAKKACGDMKAKRLTFITSATTWCSHVYCNQLQRRYVKRLFNPAGRKWQEAEEIWGAA